MLKINIGSVAALLIVAGSLIGATGALADNSPNPQPSPGRNEKIEGRCHFTGTFSGDGKGGSDFAVNCRAKLNFDKKDLWDDRASENGPDHGNDRRDRFALECDGQEVYDDGLRIRTRGEHHDKIDAIFLGVGMGAPRIHVRDLEIADKDREHHDRWDRATLNFQRWGFAYTLNGSCRFEEVRDEKPIF